MFFNSSCVFSKVVALASAFAFVAADDLEASTSCGDAAGFKIVSVYGADTTSWKLKKASDDAIVVEGPAAVNLNKQYDHFPSANEFYCLEVGEKYTFELSDPDGKKFSMCQEVRLCLDDVRIKRWWFDDFDDTTCKFDKRRDFDDLGDPSFDFTVPAPCIPVDASCDNKLQISVKTDRKSDTTWELKKEEEEEGSCVVQGPGKCDGFSPGTASDNVGWYPDNSEIIYHPSQDKFFCLEAGEKYVFTLYDSLENGFLLCPSANPNVSCELEQEPLEQPHVELRLNDELIKRWDASNGSFGAEESFVFVAGPDPTDSPSDGPTVSPTERPPTDSPTERPPTNSPTERPDPSDGAGDKGSKKGKKLKNGKMTKSIGDKGSKKGKKKKTKSM